MHDPDTERDTEAVELFDRQKIRDYFHFTRGALRRHKTLALGVFVAILGLTVLALYSLPRKYHVEAKVLAQQNQALALAGETPDPNGPTHGAIETIRGRENLAQIVRATHLVEHYAAHRSPAQRARDWVVGLFSPAPTQQERVDAMVDLLEKKLTAWTTDGTVTIGLDWTDPEMAVRLVDEAQQNFLLSRYSQEVTALVESIGIIRRHANEQKADVDDAVLAIKKLRAAKEEPKAAATKDPETRNARRVVLRAPAPPRPPSPEAKADLAQLKLAIDAKQRVIDDLEDMRRRRLSEAQAKLAELKAQYTDSHPAVVDARQTLAALSAKPPQEAALEKELAPLRAQYKQKLDALHQTEAARGAATTVASSTSATPPKLSSEIVSLDASLDRDPTTLYAREQLRDAMAKYADLREKSQEAQMSLETARAAFKYRYNVVTPPELPRKPVSPNVPLILFAALVGAIFTAVFVVVVADLRKGRLVERFQIERLLDRPLLGEIDLRLLPRHRLK